MNRGRSPEFDVIVVGAGVTGTVMASLLLARKLSTPGRVAVVADRFAAAPPASPDWDLRVFALSRASERLLKVCGIWNLLPARGCFRMSACASLMPAARRRGTGSLTFDCAEFGEPNLGYIVDGKALQWQCLQSARAAGVVLIEGAVEAISAGDDAVSLSLSDGRELRGTLLAAADGTDSKRGNCSASTPPAMPIGKTPWWGMCRPHESMPTRLGNGS